MKNLKNLFKGSPLFILLLLLISHTSQSQVVLYNPQELYDEPGGLYDQGIVRDMNVQFYDNNYHNILVNSFFINPSYRIPAQVTIDGETYDSVAIRYKGNSTFCLPNDEGNPKVPYNMDANFWVSGQKIAGYKKIKLANAWMDPTFAKEITATNVYQKYMPSPEVNLLKLNTQGNYVGLYVNTESINKQFLEKHFGEKDGVLFKCDPVQVFCGENEQYGNPDLRWLGQDSSSYYPSYDLKSESGWADLMDLIYTLNYNYSELDSLLNIDRVLWNFAVNTAILNLDTYNGYYVHNYYLYKTEDGLFQMIPWDFDNSFVGAILGYDYWSPEVVYNYDTYGSQYANGERPLLQKMLSNPLHKRQFEAHLRTVYSETMYNTQGIRDEITALQEVAVIAASQDYNKAFPMSYFYSNVDEAFWTGWGFAGIMSTIEERNDYLLSTPALSNMPPSLSGVDLVNDLVTVQVSSATNVELMATTSPYNSKFVSYPMFDDGTNGDQLAGDGVFSAMLPYSGSGLAVKYYIRAQNANAMRLSPERAEYEFYIYDPNVDVPEIEKVSYRVYPNPTNGNLYIAAPTNGALECEIYNLSGQKLMTTSEYGTHASMNLSELQKGVYILRVNGQIHKIVKE